MHTARKHQAAPGPSIRPPSHAHRFAFFLAPCPSTLATSALSFSRLALSFSLRLAFLSSLSLCSSSRPSSSSSESSSPPRPAPLPSPPESSSLSSLSSSPAPPSPSLSPSRSASESSSLVCRVLRAPAPAPPRAPRPRPRPLPLPRPRPARGVGPLLAVVGVRLLARARPPRRLGSPVVDEAAGEVRRRVERRSGSEWVSSRSSASSAVAPSSEPRRWVRGGEFVLSGEGGSEADLIPRGKVSVGSSLNGRKREFCLREGVGEWGGCGVELDARERATAG